MQPNDEQGNDAKWTFHTEEDTPAENTYAAAPEQELRPLEQVQPVSWTAWEFIAHQKDPIWYGTVLGGLVVFCGGILYVTKDVISAFVIALVVILFLVLSSKKPQQRQFTVDQQGISIGEKFYPYGMFKSFALRYEGAIGSISFIPLKRLMPEISIYFAPEDEARIVDVLAYSLPNDQRTEHGVDQLMKRLRF